LDLDEFVSCTNNVIRNVKRVLTAKRQIQLQESEAGIFVSNNYTMANSPMNKTSLTSATAPILTIVNKNGQITIKSEVMTGE